MVFDSQHSTTTLGIMVTAIDSKASRQDFIVKNVIRKPSASFSNTQNNVRIRIDKASKLG